MDTPGHPCFSDEVTAGLRLSDGILLVVDCIEGMTFYVERLIKEAMKQQLKIVVFLNKLDRLVLELKLPPNDAYFKLKHTLDDINSVIQHFIAVHGGDQPFISPVNNNVIFGSTLFECCFTTSTFAQQYASQAPVNQTKYEKHSQAIRRQQAHIDPALFSRFLWGDLFYNEASRKFERNGQSGALPRSFVHFILEPFYKIVSAAISQEKNEVEPILKKLQVHLTNKEYQLDIKPFVKLVFSKYLGDTRAIVDTLVACIPDSRKSTAIKVQKCYENRADNQEIAN
jgi:U5 small nuclear ribonucleoprotein component